MAESQLNAFAKGEEKTDLFKIKNFKLFWNSVKTEAPRKKETTQNIFSPMSGFIW